MAAVIFFESVKEVYTLYICDSSKVYGVVIIELHSFPMPTGIQKPLFIVLSDTVEWYVKAAGVQ